MTALKTAKEFRIFEEDKYGNKFYVCRHSSLESAKYYLSAVKPDGEKFLIEDEYGVQY